jgi:hypothetical protein
MHQDTCLDTAQKRNNRNTHRPCTAAATLLLPIYRACKPVYRAFSPRGMLLPSWPALPAGLRTWGKECPTAAPLVIQHCPAYVLHLSCDSHCRLQAIVIRISARDEHHAGGRNKSVGRLAEWSPRRHTTSPGYIHLLEACPNEQGLWPATCHWWCLTHTTATGFSSHGPAPQRLRCVARSALRAASLRCEIWPAALRQVAFSLRSDRCKPSAQGHGCHASIHPGSFAAHLHLPGFQPGAGFTHTPLHLSKIRPVARCVIIDTVTLALPWKSHVDSCLLLARRAAVTARLSQQKLRFCQPITHPPHLPDATVPII